jgi:hypothetical protein
VGHEPAGFDGEYPAGAGEQYQAEDELILLIAHWLIAH